MGVPNLITFLRQKAPTAFRRAKPDDLCNKRVGIDLSITLYRGAAGAYKNGPHAHLEVLLREVRWLLTNGCKPVYVIDGEAPIEKAEEAQRRVAARNDVAQRLQKAQQRCDEYPNDLDAAATVQKLEKQCVQLTAEMRLDSKVLLDALGVPCLEAPGEAERCLAHLLHAGTLDLVLTEDVDVLVCGGPSYLKNSARLMYEMEDDSCMKGFAEVVDLGAVLTSLDLSYHGFVTMAVLAGCDFVPKLPKMGPATAWKHVKRVSEDILVCLDALKVSDSNLRDRFSRAHVLLKRDAEAIWPNASEAHEPATELLESLCSRFEVAGSTAALRAYIRDIVACQHAALSPRSPKRLKQS